MSKELKIGAVVLLKSGSPKMTVSEIDGDLIMCTWFLSTTGDLKRDKFHKDELEVYEDPPIIPRTNENRYRY
jgi:uncharacterized protein YodC (DUF2158 family)